MREAFRKSLEKFRNLMVEYGVIALVIHYVIFAIVIFGFWFAIKSGWRSSTASGNAGTWAAAYVAAKITQPLRILATVAITPFVARVYERMVGRKRTSKPDAGSSS